MRKSIYKLGMLAVTAFAVVCCEKEVDKSDPQPTGVHTATVTLGKADVTKTALVEGESSASYKWNDNDNQYIKVYENGTAGTITSFTLNGDKTVATMEVSFDGNPDGPYTYTAQYAKELTNTKNPRIQASQSPLKSTFDPAADVLVSRATSDVTDVDTRLTELQFTMGRVVTINKMTLTGLEKGEVISKVEFSLSKSIVGTIGYDTENATYKLNGEGKKLTMNYTSETGVVPASGEFHVYFIAGPVEAAGIESVVVTTDKNVYTKTSTLNPNPFGGKTITFAIGTMKRFTMAMDTYGAPISTGTSYLLVESQDDLYDGATYLIVAKDGSTYYALGEQKTNNRAAVAVTEDNGVITIDNTIAAYPVVIEAVTGGYAIKDITNNGYLYNDKTDKNNLFNKKEQGDYTTWTIEITNGVASIINVDNKKRGIMAYNPNASNNSPLFAAYGNIPTGGTDDLALYIDPNTAVLLSDPNLSFSPASVSVAWDNKDSFEAPTLTKPEDLTVSVTYSSSNENVATVNESTGAITFVGNGTTTITATTAKTDKYKAGEASYTITVTGAPVAKGEGPENPFSVAEALAIIDGLESGTSNRTQEYYIAGIISVVSSYSSSFKSLTYNITADGNTSSDAITVYSGKGLNGADFSSTSDLSAGDEVIVKGCLMKYDTTPQIYQNSQIVSLVEARYFTAELSANTIPYTGGNSITLTVGANVEWTASIDNSALLKIGDEDAASSVSGSSDTNVTVIIPENTSGATYTISFSTTSDKVSAPANLTITQSDNQVTTVKKYVKVTSGNIGGEYLIVRETDKFIFDGSLDTPDSANNYQVATDLSSLDYDDWKAYAVTIETYSTGYSILTASGKYIGRNASTNGLDANATLSENYINSIEFASNGTVTILGNGGRKFNYNSNSGKFRYFASGNTTEIYLYQLQDVSE